MTHKRIAPRVLPEYHKCGLARITLPTCGLETDTLLTYGSQTVMTHLIIFTVKNTIKH